MKIRPSALTLALAAALTLASPAARSLSLAEAFEAARLHDPQYRSAQHDLQASREDVPIARAGLLPQLSLNYSSQGVSGTRKFPNALQQEVTTRVDYAAPQTQLSMRMPLFNYEAWSRLDQVTAQTKGAESQFRARGLELVERVVAAYVSVLESRAQLILVEAELTALTEQARRAEQRFQRGEGTRIDEALVQASLELLRARLIDTRDRVDVGLARLKRLTGRTVLFVNDTAAGLRPQRVSDAEVLDWIETARRQNPTLEVRQASLDAARHLVRRNQAGHLPRLDLVGNVSKARNDSLNNLDQTSHLRSIGIQLSVPLYNGGGVEAGVRQSQAELLRAEEDLRNERENNELEIRRLLQSADGAALRVQALERSVAANEVAVSGATRMQEAGLATLADVLDARSRQFSARRDLAQAQYDNVRALVQTMLLAGEPMQRVVDRADAMLSQRIDLPSSSTGAPR